MNTKKPKHKSVVIIIQERMGIKSLPGSKSFTVYDPFEKVVEQIEKLVNDEKTN